MEQVLDRTYPRIRVTDLSLCATARWRARHALTQSDVTRTTDLRTVVTEGGGRSASPGQRQEAQHTPYNRKVHLLLPRETRAHYAIFSGSVFDANKYGTPCEVILHEKAQGDARLCDERGLELVVASTVPLSSTQLRRVR